MSAPTSPSPYKYKFSFVIPVYNVEAYLAETLESVLAQDIGFEQNCEIVLVNDGSSDNSEAICLKYQTKYPRNITYVKQKNAGLSAARNTGVRAANGKYVMFIDADDKLSEGAAQEVYPFFEEHNKEIDLVALKMIFFEAKTGEHALNYRFSTTRVIDVEVEPGMPQIAGASVFFKKELFDRDFRFDESIRKYGEDTKFLTEVILEKRAYGVVKDAVYYYRQRQSGGSIMGGSRADKDWYLKTPVVVNQTLIKYSEKKFHEVPAYLQYILGYDLQWRIKQQDQEVLTDAEVKEYKSILWKTLDNVSDEIIMSQRFISLEYKLFLLGKKHKKSIVDETTPNDKGEFFYRNQLVYRPTWREKELSVDAIDFQGKQLEVGGYFTDVLFRGAKIQYKIGEKDYNVDITKAPSKVHFLGEPIYETSYTTAKMTVEREAVVTARLVIGQKSIALPFAVNTELGFDPENKWSYRTLKGYLVMVRRREIVVQKKTVYRTTARALKSKAYLYLHHHPQSSLALLVSRVVGVSE